LLHYYVNVTIFQFKKKITDTPRYHRNNIFGWYLRIDDVLSIFGSMHYFLLALDTNEVFSACSDRCSSLTSRNKILSLILLWTAQTRCKNMMQKLKFFFEAKHFCNFHQMIHTFMLNIGVLEKKHPQIMQQFNMGIDKLRIHQLLFQFLLFFLKSNRHVAL